MHCISKSLYPSNPDFLRASEPAKSMNVNRLPYDIPETLFFIIIPTLKIA